MAAAPAARLLLLLGGGGRGLGVVGGIGSGAPPSSLLLLPRWLALSRRLSLARGASSAAADPTAAAAASDGEAETESADGSGSSSRRRRPASGRRAARDELEHPSAALLPVVCVLGRPNVGKSALFNRLCGGREALVADTPAPGGHTTRDWREGVGGLGDLRFRAVDTSGLEPAAALLGGGVRPALASAAPLQARAAALTARVLARSHVALVVLDATAGVTQDDVDLGRWLRRQRALWRRQHQEQRQQSPQGGAGGQHECPPPPDPAPVAGPDGPAVLLVLNKAEARAARARMPETLADVHANLGLLLPRARPGEEDHDEDEDEEGQDGRSPAAAAAAAAAARNDDGDDDDDSRIVALSARSGEGLADLYVALRPHVEAAASALRRAHDGDADDSRPSSAAPSLPQSPLLWPPPRPPPPLPGASKTAAPPSSSPSSPPDPSLLPDWPAPDDGPMRVAIMGLPNAGKSTLLNALVGRERALTGPEPGLTRDAPLAWLEWRGGLRVELTDTAGWVPGSDRASLAADDVRPLSGGGVKDGKRGAAGEARSLAAAALERGRRAMDAAHVVVLLLDAHRLGKDGRLITKAELGLAAEAVRAGKALVVALNKADLLVGGGGQEGEDWPQKRNRKCGGISGGGGAGGGGAVWPEASKMAAELAAALDARFAEAGKPAVVALSALEAAAAAGAAGAAAGAGGAFSSSTTISRAGAAAVLDACAVAYARWTRRAGTSAVRRALDRCAARLAGTPSGDGVSRVKWASQVKARPPTFAVSLRGAKALPRGGERMLASALREGLGLEGVPVRVTVRYNAREDQRQGRGGGGGGGGGRGRGGGRRGGGGGQRR